MKSLYLQIKYIYQNSFYESCSNVKIEALISGCLFKKNINFKDYIVVPLNFETFLECKKSKNDPCPVDPNLRDICLRTRKT